MKPIRKSAGPVSFVNFANNNPNADWINFRKSKARYKAACKIIRSDQRGICAYCEIDLMEPVDAGKLPDFRIDHFHPKSPFIPPKNWALDWNNLLGVCHGGSQRDVQDAARFTSPDVCCDVPKENNNWDGVILNPLSDIPLYPRLFEFNEASGSILVDKKICPIELHQKASETIDKLKLDAFRLTEMRVAVMSELGAQINSRVEEGLSWDEAATEISAVLFSDVDSDPWPAFFTCIRWYLGAAAEDRLQSVGFQG